MDTPKFFRKSMQNLRICIVYYRSKIVAITPLRVTILYNSESLQTEYIKHQHYYTE